MSGVLCDLGLRHRLRETGPFAVALWTCRERGQPGICSQTEASGRRSTADLVGPGQAGFSRGVAGEGETASQFIPVSPPEKNGNGRGVGEPQGLPPWARWKREVE